MYRQRALRGVRRPLFTDCTFRVAANMAAAQLCDTLRHRRNIMMRASIKRSLAARRHRAKIVVCKGGEDTRSAATTGAGASLRRDVVHDLTARRLYLFSSRG